MSERKRSKDGSRDTDKLLGEQGTISQEGSAGGELNRDIGTEDERKRANERPAGHTDVTKSKEENG